MNSQDHEKLNEMAYKPFELLRGNFDPRKQEGIRRKPNKIMLWVESIHMFLKNIQSNPL